MNNTSENVIERLRNFVLAHPEMTKNGFIQGLDQNTGKIVIVVNGEEKRITIDELESGHLNQTPDVQPVSNQMSAPAEEIEVMQDVPQEKIEVMDEPSNVTAFPAATVSDIPGNEIMLDQPNNVVQFPSKDITSLKDLRESVIAKDEASVNKALETFAIDEKTGSINMNKAIKIVTDNSMNNVISSVRDNKVLPNDLSRYDIKGNPIGEFEVSNQSQDINNLIDNSFNNILVYVEAARLKNIVYNEAQIQKAKSNYTRAIQDKMNILNLNKKDEITPDNKKEEQKVMTYDLAPDKDIKKAGFADILILTIIVLIYAAIIINLITKLK